ncbi:MAG TPA: NirD/YgiW/YdeI family stress tolerance protein [Nevskiaceae bacterium]|nr:NirD/YgiW/YdeI family stress tolerance protein [Nevskiaceae bacterium]
MRVPFRTTLAAVACTLAVASTSAFAAYTGPSAVAPQTTVASILKNPVDDAHVTLKGHLLQKTNKKDYVFSDGTGKIPVKIDPHRLPTADINAQTTVELYGEVDKDFMKPVKVDVKRVTIMH